MNYAQTRMNLPASHLKSTSRRGYRASTFLAASAPPDLTATFTAIRALATMEEAQHLEVEHTLVPVTVPSTLTAAIEVRQWSAALTEIKLHLPSRQHE